MKIGKIEGEFTYLGARLTFKMGCFDGVGQLVS